MPSRRQTPGTRAPVRSQLRCGQRRIVQKVQRTAAYGRAPSAGGASSGRNSFVLRLPQLNHYHGRPLWWNSCSRRCTWMTALNKRSAGDRESCGHANTRRRSRSLSFCVIAGTRQISHAFSSDSAWAGRSKFDLGRRTDEASSRVVRSLQIRTFKALGLPSCGFTSSWNQGAGDVIGAHLKRNPASRSERSG